LFRRSAAEAEAALAAIEALVASPLRRGGIILQLFPVLRAREFSHLEIFAEIEAPDVGMGDDVVRAALGQHMAAMDDIGAVDEAERLAHIVVGDEHADASPLQVPHEVLDVADGDRIDAGETARRAA